MHGVRQWWVRLSIVNKAIVLSCAFVIPILLVVGLLMNDFYDYREKSNDILSEYARCTDYINAGAAGKCASRRVDACGARVRYDRQICGRRAGHRLCVGAAA